EAVDLTQLIRSFLKSHLTRDCLTTVAFMGIQSRSEPWVFFFTRPNAVTGKFELAGSSAQMLSFVTSNVVVPKPTNRQFHTSDGAVGVATDLLFSVGSRDKLLFPAATEAPLKDVKVRHIPDIVANPQLSHVFNTDCVSCHTESALRHLELEGAIT